MESAKEYAAIFSVEEDADALIRDIEHHDLVLESLAVVLEMQQYLSDAQWRRLRDELIRAARKR